MTDSPQASSLKAKHNVSIITPIFRSMSWNDCYNLVHSGKVIASGICIVVQMESDNDFILLFRWFLMHDLKCMLIQGHIWMGSMEHILKLQHQSWLEICIASISKSQLLCRVMNIQLSIRWLSIWRRQQRSCPVMEFSTDLEAVWARSFSHRSVNLDTHRSECKSCIILSDILLEVSR